MHKTQIFYFIIFSISSEHSSISFKESIELQTKFGTLETNGNKISKFKEKKEISNLWMNAGVYFLQKEILKDLPNKGDIEKTLFPEYAKKGKLNTIKFKKIKWYSIDSIKDVEESSLEIEKIIK